MNVASAPDEAAIPLGFNRIAALITEPFRSLASRIATETATNQAVLYSRESRLSVEHSFITTPATFHGKIGQKRDNSLN